jgi:hypothetical protein
MSHLSVSCGLCRERFPLTVYLCLQTQPSFPRSLGTLLTGTPLPSRVADLHKQRPEHVVEQYGYCHVFPPSVLRTGLALCAMSDGVPSVSIRIPSRTGTGGGGGGGGGVGLGGNVSPKMSS